MSYKDHVTDKEVCTKIKKGKWATQRPDHHKEMQTEVVQTCLPFIRSGQNQLVRHNERGKKTRQTKKSDRKIYLVSWYFELSQPQRITS